MGMRKLMRIPRITTVAVLTLTAAACDSGDVSNGISADVNTTEDAAVDEVLGANDNATIATNNSSQQP